MINKLHQGQAIVAKDNHDFRVVDCGRQWGKTTLAVEEMKACAYFKKVHPGVPNNEIAYFATTFDQARNIAWTMLKEVTRPIWDRLPNESRLELWVKTKYKELSRLTLRGFENIETARGQQFDLLVGDEIAFMRNWKYAWESILEPTLAFRKGKALFISTPQGFNHFYDLYVLGQDPFNKYYKSWRFKSEENPFLPKERLEQAKETSTPDYYAQEYEADFRKFTGLVYKEFQREVHVIDQFDVPDSFQIYRGMDFGSTNPTACLWIAVDADENCYVVGEHFATGETIDYHAGRINSHPLSKRVSQTFGDPSGAQWISEFAQRGIYITPANKEVGTNFNSWVRFGIEKVSERLKRIPGKIRTFRSDGSLQRLDEGKGEPSLYIFNNCQNTIREFETYRWKEKSVTQAQDLNEPDVPEKANDHAMDALRYFAVSYGGKQEEYIPQDDDIVNKNWSLK